MASGGWSDNGWGNNNNEYDPWSTNAANGPTKNNANRKANFGKKNRAAVPAGTVEGWPSYTNNNSNKEPANNANDNNNENENLNSWGVEGNEKVNNANSWGQDNAVDIPCPSHGHGGWDDPVDSDNVNPPVLCSKCSKADADPAVVDPGVNGNAWAEYEVPLKDSSGSNHNHYVRPVAPSKHRDSSQQQHIPASGSQPRSMSRYYPTNYDEPRGFFPPGRHHHHHSRSVPIPYIQPAWPDHHMQNNDYGQHIVPYGEHSPHNRLRDSFGGFDAGGYPNGFDGGYRPNGWRRDFTMRSGLSSLIPRQLSGYGDSNYGYGIGSTSAYARTNLHPFLRYTHSPQSAPIHYDLRMPPRTLSFRAIPRPINSADLSRFACEPPMPHLRLYHSRLPWYIDVHASNPTGVTLGDLFVAIYGCLRHSIGQGDWYNEEMGEEEREKIGWAFQARCAGEGDGRRGGREMERGVRRVDFLRRKVVFGGLVIGRGGMWEVKTRKGGYDY